MADGGGRKKSSDDVTLDDRRQMPVHCGNRGRFIVSCTVDTARAPAHSRIHIPAQAGLCSRVRGACSVCVVTSLVLGVLRRFIVPSQDANVIQRVTGCRYRCNYFWTARAKTRRKPDDGWFAARDGGAIEIRILSTNCVRGLAAGRIPGKLQIYTCVFFVYLYYYCNYFCIFNAVHCSVHFRPFGDNKYFFPISQYFIAFQYIRIRTKQRFLSDTISKDNSDFYIRASFRQNTNRQKRSEVCLENCNELHTPRSYIYGGPIAIPIGTIDSYSLDYHHARDICAQPHQIL